MPFGFGVAVLAPAVLGAGLLAGYVLLRAHNVRVFPRCEFPLVPWTAWHLLRVGIVLFAVARWVGLGIAWALHLQASRAAWSWLPTGPVVVGGGSLTTLLVCAFIVGLVAGGRESAFRLLGLWEPRPLRRAAVGVAGLLLVLPLVLLATVAALMLAPRIGLSARPQEVLLRIAGASPRALAFVLFSVVVLTPLAEELLFRGFFYATLRRYLGPLGAIVLSALTFALLHSHPVGVPPLFVIGFLLGYLYERTGSLAAPIAAHAAYNLYVLLLTHLARQELWG
jgi:membrane protease YdiL (CAAX protease family)